MNRPAEESRIDLEQEQAVVKYLRQHSDLLTRHPDLINVLELPYDDHGTASLAAYQLRNSKQRINELERQLGLLIRVAKDNEHLLSRMYHLTLEVASAESPAEFIKRLEQQLRDKFELDHFALVIPDEALPGLHNPRIRRPASDPTGELARLLQTAQAVSGRLTCTKAHALFGEQANVGSAAIAPVDDFGLLAVASHDENRFAPDVGVLFLTLLGNTLRHRLEP